MRLTTAYLAHCVKPTFTFQIFSMVAFRTSAPCHFQEEKVNHLTAFLDFIAIRFQRKSMSQACLDGLT